MGKPAKKKPTKGRARAKGSGPPPEQWPANQVELRPVEALLAYPRNARIHTPEQVAQIAKSMTEFGWTIPILVDEAGVIIAGHGRLQAANKLGLPEAPVMTARGWSKEKKNAYRLADNQLTLNASWDPSILSTELRQLSDHYRPLTGFSSVALVSFMAGVNGANEWQGMPGFEPGRPNSDYIRSLTIFFQTQADVDKFSKKLGIALDADVKTLFLPAPVKHSTKAKQYVRAA